MIQLCLNRKRLLKVEVDYFFKRNILPEVIKTYEKDGIIDIPARRQAYNNYVNSLSNDGQISVSQSIRFCIPKECLRKVHIPKI